VKSYEFSVGDQRAPVFGNRPEPQQRFHWQSLEDFDQQVSRKLLFAHSLQLYKKMYSLDLGLYLLGNYLE